MEDISNINEEYFNSTEYLVEATDYEGIILWEKYSKEVNSWSGLTVHNNYYIIGKIDNRPITVRIDYYRINNRVIGFYEGSSALVDHTMIRNWLMKKFPHADHCNAMNFHHCLDYIENGPTLDEKIVKKILE